MSIEGWVFPARGRLVHLCSGLSAAREQGPREALFKAGTLEGAQDPAGRSGREKPLPQVEPMEPLFSEEAAKGKETGWKNCS